MQIFNSISAAYESNAPGHELILKSLLLQAIAVLLPYGKEESLRPQLRTEHMGKLKLVLEYISEHYAEELSIAQLAKLCFFSEYHFMRFFKRHMNMTSIEYLNQYRLEMASRQLAETNLSVTSIALESGFNNISYFNRVFKRKFGVTPMEYRAYSKKS